MVTSLLVKDTRERKIAGSMRCRFSSSQMHELQCICGTWNRTRVIPSFAELHDAFAHFGEIEELRALLIHRDYVASHPGCSSSA